MRAAKVFRAHMIAGRGQPTYGGFRLKNAVAPVARLAVLKTVSLLFSPHVLRYLRQHPRGKSHSKSDRADGDLTLVLPDPAGP